MTYLPKNVWELPRYQKSVAAIQENSSKPRKTPGQGQKRDSSKFCPIIGISNPAAVRNHVPNPSTEERWFLAFTDHGFHLHIWWVRRLWSPSNIHSAWYIVLWEYSPWDDATQNMWTRSYKNGSVLHRRSVDVSLVTNPELPTEKVSDCFPSRVCFTHAS